MNQPPIHQADIDVGEDELSGIRECIEARWLTEGPKSRQFADLLREFTGSPYVTFAPNGTLALYLSLLSLDLPTDSEILIPSLTFYGSATAAVFAGLRPVFVDVDPETFNLDTHKLEAVMGPDVRAIMPVHLFGQACNMDGVLAFAQAYDLKVLEDAAQGIGVRYRDSHVGTLGDIGIFSFFSDKVMTTGEGAAVVVRDPDVFQRCSLLRNQGRPHSGTFLHPELGMNFRITDLHAAIGIAQLGKFSRFLDHRTRLWNLYTEGLSDLSEIQPMRIAPESNLVPFRFAFLATKKTELCAFLEERGIGTRSFFYPMHMQPRLSHYRHGSVTTSEDLHQRGLCLPVHQHLTEKDIRRITGTIVQFYT
jgi:perosamine synthetase